MIIPDTISKTDFDHDSLQFEELLRLGIIYAEEVSGSIWTDFNEHDPGVTILEYLCYAITDVAYRADFSIYDLLYSKIDKPKKINNAFFPAHEVLPSGALTITDYRKLIVDRIEGVQNAWIKPLKSHIHKYQGLYKVYLQILEDGDHIAENIVDNTWILLQENRNLCEDFEDIVILKTDTFKIEASIHIQSDAIPEEIYANIVYNLEHFLNPSINFLNPDELKRMGLSNNEIYNGPQMKNGIINDSDLKMLNQQWYVADFKDTVASVKGVSKIDKFVVRHNGLRVQDDLIILEDETYPILDNTIFTDAYGNIPIQFKRNGVSISINHFQTQQIYHSLSRNEKKGYQLQYAESLVPFQNQVKPLGNLFDYVSIQQFFPHIYGISSYGLPVGSSPKRKYQAKQLKGYLAFFEIFLKNYLARLKNIRYLFDIESKDTPTFFSEFPFEIPDILPLLKSTSTNAQEDILQKLQDAHQQKDEGLKQANEFMSHLLARFGIDEFRSFHDNSAVKDGNALTKDRKQLDSKQSILKDFIKLSSHRAKGFNYTKATWSTENVSSLKKRICIESDINQYQDDFIANTEATKNLLFTKQQRKQSNNNQFSLKEMMNYGIDRNRYIIKRVESIYFLEYQSSYEDTPRVILESEVYEDCRELRNSLVEQFQQMNEDSERFFLIEHLLLRPKQSLKWNLKFGPNSLEPLLMNIEKTEIKELDNISNQLIVVATRRNNYSILKGEHQYFILLKNNNNPILISEEKYNDIPSAEKDIEHIINEILNIKNTNPNQIESWVHLEQDRIDNVFIESKFFHSRLSCVIPNWNSKFQNEEFRNYFQYLVGLHTPAHIAVDFRWLNFSEMQLFENLYKTWLEQKQLANTDDEVLDQLSNNLIQFLREEKVEIQNEDIPNKSRSLSETILKAIFEDISIARLYNQNDLSLIKGITGDIEKALQEKGVDNWEKLAQWNSVFLFNELNQLVSDININQIQFWINQAQLGINGQWQELYRLQNEQSDNN